jgi:hypothetical protein
MPVSIPPGPRRSAVPASPSGEPTPLSSAAPAPTSATGSEISSPTARGSADAAPTLVEAATVDAARVRATSGPAAQALQQRLLTVTEGTSTVERRARVKAVVDELVGTRGGESMLTAVDGPCLDIAAAWLPALRAAGLPARIATVDPALRSPAGPPVRAGHEGKFHAFIVVGEAAQEPIVVDGSWRQFIAGAASRTDLEPVLVGTHADIVRRFTPEARALQVERVEDPLLGRREAAATADLVYGAGPHASLRLVLEP